MKMRAKYFTLRSNFLIGRAVLLRKWLQAKSIASMPLLWKKDTEWGCCTFALSGIYGFHLLPKLSLKRLGTLDQSVFSGRRNEHGVKRNKCGGIFYILHFNGTIDCVFWGPECAIFIVIFSILDYLKIIFPKMPSSCAFSTAYNRSIRIQYLRFWFQIIM